MTEEDMGGYKFGEDVEVTIGEGDTLLSELFDKILCSMKMGEYCYIKTKVDETGKKLGEFDLKEKSLKFNVALKLLNRAADQNELEPDERLERAQHHKDRGSELFQAGRTDFAVKRYHNAVRYLLDIPSEQLLPVLSEQYQKLNCQCQLNLGACFLKIEQFEKVIEACTKALELEPKNIKGLFRRGQAYMKMDKFDEAKMDFSQAQELEPGNKAVIGQINTLNNLIKKEKDTYRKMFS